MSFTIRLLMMACICIAIPRQCFAQDTIITRSGRRILVESATVDRHRVRFRKSEGSDTEQHWRDLRFVQRVSGRGGRQFPFTPQAKLRFKEAREQRLETTPGLTFGFFGLQLFGNYGGPAAGLGHERYIGKRRCWSLGLTLTGIAMSEAGFLMKEEGSYTTLNSVYLSPGFGYHFPPLKHKAVASIGISTPLGIINRADHVYLRGNGIAGTNRRSYFLAAIEGFAAVRVLSTHAFTFMTQVSAGPVLSYPSDFPVSARAAFCVGFRH